MTSQLLGKYPNFAFIGEESYYPGIQLTEKPTFVVDPIDGTTNFIHGYPNVCISLAVLIGKVPTIGVVYNPFHGELYTAIKGRGGFVTKDNGEKRQLPLKKNPEPLRGLSNCIVGVEWGYDRTGQPFDLKARVFTKLAAAKEDGGSMVRGLKCIGSSALQLCYVATGQQDAWWEGGVWVSEVLEGLRETVANCTKRPGMWQLEHVYLLKQEASSLVAIQETGSVLLIHASTLLSDLHQLGKTSLWRNSGKLLGTIEWITRAELRLGL